MTSIAFLDEIQISVRGALSGAVGPSAKRQGGVFLESRASGLAKGFKNSSPAWLAKRSPTASPSVLICATRYQLPATRYFFAFPHVQTHYFR